MTVVRKGNLSQPLAVPVTQQTITAKSRECIIHTYIRIIMHASIMYL